MEFHGDYRQQQHRLAQALQYQLAMKAQYNKSFLKTKLNTDNYIFTFILSGVVHTCNHFEMIRSPKL
jgi:hypothetical protein